MPVVTIRIGGSRTDSSTGRARRRSHRMFLAVALISVAGLAVAEFANATGSISSKPSVYTAIAAVKVVSAHVLTAGGSTSPVVTGGTTTVPNSATSVTVGIDVSAGTTSGTIDVFPAGGTPEPAMRWTVGQSETEQLSVPVGTSRKITIKNLTGKVTVTVRVMGYDAPPDAPTTYTTSPASAAFLWNSQYIYETSANSYTEYFTRYDNVSVPALTQSVLDSGSLQVFMTPAPNNVPSAWLPLPYQFDSSFGYTYNFTYVASVGHVSLMFYFIQTDPNATLPTLSTYAINTYNFKIVITPNSAGANSAARPQPAPAGHMTCTAIPGGRTCTTRR